MPMRLQKSVSRPPTDKLLRTYVLEAGRLRELALSVTTKRVRARLLEEAANQERLAEEAKRGVFRPPASADLHFASPISAIVPIRLPARGNSFAPDQTPEGTGD